MPDQDFMPTTQHHEVNIAGRLHKSNPFPLYAQLRAEQPVCPVKLPDGRTMWLVTRYDDVATVLKDERFVKNPANVDPAYPAPKQLWVPKFAHVLTRHMLNMDKADHTRLRSLVNKAFSPRLVEQMRGRIESLTTELLLGKRGQNQIDLVKDYAMPIPTTIISEMLGVPAEDHARFNRWTNTVMQAATTRFSMIRGIPDVWALIRYIRRFVRERQQNPQDDLTSELVNAEVDGEQLNEAELVSMVFLLIVAGHETTLNLIGTGMLALMQHPEQLQMLRDDPSLIDTAVEELLRYSSPVEMGTERWARKDVTIAGVDIPGGSLMGVMLASANRDENQFADPDTVNIRRDPNRHVAFGLGAHYCTGAPLARLETQIAINTLLQMAPHLEVAVNASKLRWRQGLVTRGVESLPVTVQWRGIDDSASPQIVPLHSSSTVD